ncbi:hypothetical protein DBR11_02165 [Pedobacter sp. HMWF019]|uniref:hypothetical protein n=1 Tax=Pedobacter sp. HMWF019 TaxID=2056856 RepID=UPI000D36C736|nr:hypothetical protein [Pedobacter sp. HMWF019]PTT03462.1 hypothetical protein DBR11_02165 [Pedobacter sp. HMWF019]
MITTLNLLALLALVSVCYQDMRYRGVYWIFFPVLSALFFFLKLKQVGWVNTLQDAGYAITFLVVQLLLVWLYFSVKHRKLFNIVDSYLGLGDILFLLTLAFYLSPLNYVVFYLLSLILVLVYVLVTKRIKGMDHIHIPLAGLQAAFLAMLLFWDLVQPQLQLCQDSWIYKTYLFNGI